jgi:hypothetical protein
MSVYSEKLDCTVKAMSYDFETKTGSISAPSANLSNLRAVVKLFQEIDPDVSRIEMTCWSDVQTSEYPIVFTRETGIFWNGRIIYPDGLELGPDNVPVV